MVWAAHRTRAVVGAVAAVASFGGGLAWARLQRRSGRIIREAVDRVLASDSHDAADAVIAEAMGRLRRSASSADAMAAVAGLGLLARRRKEPAVEPGDRGTGSALVE